MLTREQWEALARFAGFIPLNCMCVDMDDRTIGIQVQGEKNGRAFDWTPLTDWNDFGLLLVLLLRWFKNKNALDMQPLSRKIEIDFGHALYCGTEQELMQAGCLLGAAIGATMGDK